MRLYAIDPPKQPDNDKPGYVYIMRFSSGATKVGRTQNISLRKRQHGINAEVHGFRLTEVWSLWVREHKYAEKVAIYLVEDQLESKRLVRTSPEWWADVDYPDLIEELETWFGQGTRRREPKPVCGVDECSNSIESE